MVSRLPFMLVSICLLQPAVCGQLPAQLVEAAPVSIAVGSQEASEPLLAESPPVLVNMAVDQSGRELGLEELQSIAMATNAAIRVAQERAAAARGRAVQAGLMPNPAVGLDFQQLFSDGQAEQYGVSAAQTIVRKEKLQLSQSVALHEVQRLMHELSGQRLRVQTDTRIAYIRTLRAQRQIDVARELVVVSRTALELTRRLFDADEIPRTDVLQAELEVQTAELTLNAAENRHIAAWRQLEAVVGQPISGRPLAGDLFSPAPELDFNDRLTHLRTTSPQIAAQRAAIERARCQLRREQVEPLPNIDASGLINWRDNGIGGRADAGLAIALPLPLWNKNQGAIHEAWHLLHAEQRELERLEQSLAAELAPAFEQFLNAQQRVMAFRDQIIPKSEETLELVRHTFELGEANFQTLLLAQRSYAQHRLDYMEALEMLKVAQAKIEGLLLTGSLRQP